MSPHDDIAPAAPWIGRAILHMDLDAFFASVEQLDHPEWRGKPVLVGGSPEGRGVISTASYEARRFGCHSAMPSARAARLCPDAIWAPSRFERYHEMADAVMAILGTFAATVEQVSIDEAYLDVTPTPHHPEHPAAVARAISERIDALGITCSIGIGTSKTVAKIASDHKKPHGITVVAPGEEAAFLGPLPITALPGVGGVTATRLRSAGIRTLGDLGALDALSAESLLGSHGPGLVARARGIDDRPVANEDDVKSVSAEHTFATDMRERAEVEREIGQLVARVVRRLRKKGLAGRTLTVKLRYGDFTTRTASHTLLVASDLEAEILPEALALLRSSWTPGAGLRLLGFAVSGFATPTRQLDLFTAAEDTERARRLEQSIDRVRERFGSDALVHGSDIEAAGEE